MSSRADRARAVAFLRAQSLRRAGQTEPFSWGIALFEPRLPHVWHLNSVWVDAVPDEACADAFIGAIERLQGSAGLAHRQAIVADEASGDRLFGPLSGLGWSATRDLLMAWRRAPDRPSAPTRLVEVDVDGACRFTATMLEASPQPLPEKVRAQLVTARRVLADDGARFLGTAVAGEIVSLCELYVVGDTARIGAVETLPEHRNNGFARTVVGSAAADARNVGCDLVFLEAEEQDWPQQLYRKLGFDQIGYVHEFILEGTIGASEPREPLEYRSGSPAPASDPEPGDGGAS